MEDTLWSANRKLVGTVIVLLFIVAAETSIIIGLWVYPEMDTCDDFQKMSWADANRAFLNGNTALDGDGDGIPCESLK